jgi:hypothetical protein
MKRAASAMPAHRSRLNRKQLCVCRHGGGSDFGAGGTLWCRKRSCVTPAISIWNGAISRPPRASCEACALSSSLRRLPRPRARRSSSPWSASRRPRPPSRHARWRRLSKLPRRRRCRWRRNSKRNPNTPQCRMRSMQQAQPGGKARPPSRKRAPLLPPLAVPASLQKCRPRPSLPPWPRRPELRRKHRQSRRIRRSMRRRRQRIPRPQLRVASAQNAVKPTALPLAHNVVGNSVVSDNNNVLRDDDSLLARTMGVTDHVIAATQRAVSTIGVIPTWIGSIGNRLGG